MSDVALAIPKETAKAAQAFADYVAMGPRRSLAKLAASHGKNSKNLWQYEKWSVDYQWQERLKQIAAGQLEYATGLHTETYVLISGEYHRRVSDEAWRKSMALPALHGIYDRVKPDTPSSNQPAGGNVLIQFVFNEVPGGR